MRNGAKHSAEDCAICSGRECRVKVISPVDGEFEAQLIPLADGRTRFEDASPLAANNNREIESSGMSGMFSDPRLIGWTGERYDPRALRILARTPIRTATLLAMQSLQTWGPSHARL